MVFSRRRKRLLALLTLLLLAAVASHAQVVLDGNQIVGTVELTNTNPEILAEIDADAASVSASAPDLSSSTTVPAAHATYVDYLLTVDAGPPGEGIVFNLAASLDVGPYWYRFASQTSPPVEREPAPDVEVDFSECAGLLRAH